MKHKTLNELSDRLVFAEVKALMEGLETEPSETTPALRKALVARGKRWGLGVTPEDDIDGISPELQKYADKCSRYAYKVFDREVDELKAQGTTEPEIVDVTLASAFGVSLGRLERGLTLLEETEGAAIPASNESNSPEPTEGERT